MATDSLVRVFIAVNLPPEVKSLLRQAQTMLRQQDLAVRWVNSDSTHLTLKFLGEISVSLIDLLVERMTEVAARHPRIELRTGTLGVFPNPARPRVVWLGLLGDVPALRRLQADVEQVLIPLGFAVEHRPFAPHLTLGRTLKEVDKARLQMIGRAVAQTSIRQSIHFEVEEITLMRSHLQPSGALYTTLAQATLRQ